MIVICAWCQTRQLDRGQDSSDEATHSICPRCDYLIRGESLVSLILTTRPEESKTKKEDDYRVYDVQTTTLYELSITRYFNRDDRPDENPFLDHSQVYVAIMTPQTISEEDYLDNIKYRGQEALDFWKQLAELSIASKIRGGMMDAHVLGQQLINDLEAARIEAEQAKAAKTETAQDDDWDEPPF
jgi:hypothetical protein